MVANYLTLLVFRRRPAALCRSPVGEIPAEKKGVLGFRLRRNVSLQAEGADGVLDRRVLPKFAVAREIIPENKRTHGPARAGAPPT